MTSKWHRDLWLDTGSRVSQSVTQFFLDLDRGSQTQDTAGCALTYIFPHHGHGTHLLLLFSSFLLWTASDFCTSFQGQLHVFQQVPQHRGLNKSSHVHAPFQGCWNISSMRLLINPESWPLLRLGPSSEVVFWPFVCIVSFPLRLQTSHEWLHVDFQELDELGTVDQSEVDLLCLWEV